MVNINMAEFGLLNQYAAFAQEYRKEYMVGRILSQEAADKEVYTSQDYYNGCMHKRNRHLVNNSSKCICYFTEKPGGTFYTVKYASERGLSIVNIAV